MELELSNLNFHYFDGKKKEQKQCFITSWLMKTKTKNYLTKVIK